MPTLQELINKALAESCGFDTGDGSWFSITHDQLEEFGKACYMEGVNSGKPWGGSKVDHLENFLKPE